MEGAPEDFSMKGYPYFVSCPSALNMFIFDAWIRKFYNGFFSFWYETLQMKKCWFTREGLERFCKRLDSFPKWPPYINEEFVDKYVQSNCKLSWPRSKANMFRSVYYNKFLVTILIEMPSRYLDGRIIIIIIGIS